MRLTRPRRRKHKHGIKSGFADTMAVSTGEKTEA
jgi:hypothetical protein